MALNPQAQAELADMMLALAHNPKTRTEVARLAKTAGLPVTFNDVEASDAALAVAGKVAEQAIAKDRETQRTEAIKRQTETARADLVASGRFTAETIKELEGFMTERGIGSYEDGAILYNHANPPATTHSQSASMLWEMPKGDWLTDTKGTARREAHKVIAEITSARR